jgi:hypothetical protein
LKKEIEMRAKLNTRLSSLLVCLASSGIAAAQCPDTLWSFTYGGSSYVSVFAGETPDGCFMEASRLGYSSGMMVAKLDASGQQEWLLTRDDVIPFSSVITTDGDIVISGYTNPGYRQAVLIAFDGDGQFLWKQTYGEGGESYGRPVDQAPDGGFVLAGTHNVWGEGQEAWLWRTDAEGNLLWDHGYGTNTVPHDCLALSDGRFLIVSQGYYQMMKVGPDGELIWSRHYDTAVSGVAAGTCADGGYALLALGNSVFHLIKTDALGTLEWQTTYGNADGYLIGFSVEQTWDSGFIMAGTIQRVGSDTHPIMIRADTAGTPLWEIEVPYTLPSGYFVPVGETSDGGYILSGMGNSRVIRYAPCLGVEDDEQAPSPVAVGSPSPNPFSSEMQISYSLEEEASVAASVYDLSGRCVAELSEGVESSGQHSLTWDGTHATGEACPAGVYLVRISSAGFSRSAMVILLR